MATGVYTAYKKDGTEYYRVSLTCQNKHISLGSFDDYKTAAAVYSEANAIVRDEKSSHFVNAAEKITSYSSCTSALAFEKFMILLNLRAQDGTDLSHEILPDFPLPEDTLFLFS